MVCVSSVVRDDLVFRIGLHHPELVVIENGVDIDRFRPAESSERQACRVRFGLPVDGTVAVTSGRLHPDKRIDLAIEAVRGQTEVTLLIAGSGQDRDPLRAIARGLPVVFAGQVGRDVDLLYRAADVLLLPSGSAAREGFPMALLEAAASGVPAVVTSDSGLAPLLGGSGARIVTGEPGAILRAVTDLRAGSADGSPRAWASKRSLTQCVTRYWEVFQSVASN